jgi:hypothetical protein
MNKSSYDELCWLPHRGTPLNSVEYAKQQYDKGALHAEAERLPTFAHPS